MAKDKDKELSKISTSWLGRTFETAKMAGGIASSLASEGAKALFTRDEDKKAAHKQKGQVDAAIRTVLQLGKVKGGLMKIGQLASYIDTVIPDEVREVLTSLQDKTPPMKNKEVQKILKEELGGSSGEVFAEFEERAFSAASIGQVHRAKTKEGDAVAVKIQYPGIESAFESDLKNASLMGNISKLIFQAADIDDIVDELRERLMEECNYELELSNQNDFRDLFADYPEMIFPKTFPNYSSRRVLTSEMIEGKRFSDHVKECSQEERNHIGRIVFTMVMTSIFKHAIFNGDPHPGNYLVVDDKIAFLDFGCVKRWEADFIAKWRKLIRCGYEDNFQGFSDGFVDLGFVKHPDKFDFAEQWRLNKLIWQPFLTEGRYTFTHDYNRMIGEELVYNNKNFFQTNLPRDFVIINRLQWGMVSIMAELQAEFNAYEIMHPMVYSDV